MGVTSPDNIYFTDVSSPSNDAVASATQAGTVQDALAKRSRHNYSWANANLKPIGAIVEGSRGYQIDTKTEYIFQSGVWVLALPYAEFTASKSLSATFSGGLGSFTRDTAASTDTTFVVPLGDGTLTLVNPGVYSVQSYTDMGAVLSSPGSLDLYVNSVLINRQSMPTSEFVSGNTAPVVRTVSTNATLTFTVNKSTAGTATANTRVRIARIG